MYTYVFINKESRLKVPVCIYHHMLINGRSHFKVSVCVYHRVFISGKSRFIVAVWIYHHGFIDGKSQINVVVLTDHYIFFNEKVVWKFSSMGKSLESWGIYKSSCVDQFHRKSHFKVAVCICHHVFSTGKVV